jgi:hypothetical protein
MDNQCLVVLSKFAVAARQAIGPMNPAKLIKDAEYSAHVFDRVFAQGDEALILLALEVQSLLSLNTESAGKPIASIAAIKPELKENPKSETSKVEVKEQKYMFGARS